MNRRFFSLALAGSVAALAVLAACSDSSNSSNNPPPAADVSVVAGAAIKGFQAFSPDTLTVSLSGGASVEVVWRNDDVAGGGVLHTVTDTTAANAFNVQVQPGDTSSVTFTVAGAYPYKCNIHPSMRGLIVVTP
jgi:plastocyanin